jgi:hypothetical protein
MEIDNFNSIGHRFCNEMMALADDFFEIANDKVNSIVKQADSLKASRENRKSINFHEIKNLTEDNLKHGLFRIAMFNYMNSIFERGTNDLLKLSVKEDVEVKSRFIEKFIDLDNHKIKNGQTSIRNAKFELMSQKDRDQVYIKYFKEVSECLPPLINWKYFYDISDRSMWSNKNLRFDFNEIRSRRNLLTHRGIHYDDEYVERVLYGATKSKNVAEPQERIEFYFKRGLFTSNKKASEEAVNLYSLVNTENPVPVVIKHSYFNHSFSILLYIYLKLWSHATKSDDLFVSVAHDLLVRSRKLPNSSYVFFVLSLLNDFHQDFNGEISSDFLKANHLLAFREMNKLAKEAGKKLFEPKKYELEFLEYFKFSSDPKFKVLISVYDNDFDGAISNLQLCKGLHESSKNWFLFSDLIQDSRFDAAFESATSPI